MLTVWCLVTQRRASTVFIREPAGDALFDAARLTREVQT